MLARLFGKAENRSSPAARGFKLTTTTRERRIGVAAASLKILKKKAKEKLKVDNCRIYLSSDGTEVVDEDYFATIPDQSVFIVAAEKEQVKTDFQLILECFRDNNSELLKAAEGSQEYLENNREKIQEWLDRVVGVEKGDQDVEDQIIHSLKSDDPDWFQGSDSKFNSKEEAMFRRAQDRIRGYFYKLKDELTKNELYKTSSEAREHLDGLLRIFRIFLHGCDHFGCLFDRSKSNLQDELDAAGGGGGEPLNKKCKTAVTNAFIDNHLFVNQCKTLCDREGSFQCEGPWDKMSCPRSKPHVINPYRNRETLVVFQTWNLDHQIEFGRSVVPKVIAMTKELIEGRGKVKCFIHGELIVSLNAIQIFLELFTTDNLKLVHIACHEKGAHSGLDSHATLMCNKCPDFIKLNEFLRKVE